MKKRLQRYQSMIALEISPRPEREQCNLSGLGVKAEVYRVGFP